MNKNKTAVIIICTILVVLIAVIVVFTLANRGGVAQEYQYNTSIVENTNAPVQGDPDVASIDGFIEHGLLELAKTPIAVPDTSLSVVSVGGYNGDFDNGEKTARVEDLFSVVVTNTSDKVVSYSNFVVEYADGKTCSFSPTNLPPHQSSIVFESTGEVNISDVECFEITDSMAVYSDELPIIRDKVGVSYEDGVFVVTNLTNENLGDVYIRYKNISNGNAYLGGNTYSVFVQNVEPFETYKIPADNYNPDTSVILVVENIQN